MRGALLGVHHPISFVICSSCCRCAVVVVVVFAVVVSLLLLAKGKARPMRKYKLQNHMLTTLFAMDHTPSPSFNVYDLPSHPHPVLTSATASKNAMYVHDDHYPSVRSHTVPAPLLVIRSMLIL